MALALTFMRVSFIVSYKSLTLRRVPLISVNTFADVLILLYKRTTKLERMQPKRSFNIRSLTSRYNKPDRVHPNKIRPEIERLGAKVLLAQYNIIIQARCEIKQVAIYMACRDKRLERIAISGVTDDQPGCDEAEWPQHKLSVY